MPQINVKDDLSDWMSLRPELGAGLEALGSAVYKHSQLPTREREIARMRIAEANGCQVCHNARVEHAAGGTGEDFYQHMPQWRTWSGYSERERLAAEFAEQFALDHLALSANEAFWVRLRAQFRDDEIVDLGICCSLWVGAGRLMRVLDVGQSCELTLPGRAA